MSHVAVGQEPSEAVAYLLGRIDYERMLSVPYRTPEYKLDRMRDLLSRLGDPQDRLRIVHVGGTKGKGSTAAMIAGVLSAAGLRTGLFTSPHLDRLEERLAIDGQPCRTERLSALVAELRSVVDGMDAEAARAGNDTGPTFFELTTALALMHFTSAEVEAAVLEVGMGGRLDSTNVCHPLCTVITSVSLDHTQQLGNTLAQIAGEKAGIVKPGVPLVSGVVEEEPRRVIVEIARQRGALLLELGRDFDFVYHPPRAVDRAAAAATIDFRHRRTAADTAASGEVGPPPGWRLDGLELGMWGRHQGANAAVVLAVVEQLRQRGWQIPDEAIRRGIRGTRCPARVELVSRRPAVVVDAAHNVASVAALLDVLAESFAAQRRVLFFATSRDKDARGMLSRLLPVFDAVILTRYQDNPRGIPPEELAAVADELGCTDYCVAANPAEAWQAASRCAGPDDLLLVTGSFFIAAEIRRLLVGGA